MKTSYAQNLVSSVNVTLAALRGDHAIEVSPSRLIGPRTAVRTIAPEAMDRASVVRAGADLWARGHHSAACLIRLARDLGAREREACLLDCRQALMDARDRGHVFITRGTKGGRGRYIPRVVPVSEEALASLQQAAAVQGDGTNLIPPEMQFSKFRNHVVGVAIPALRRHGCRHIHDLRASYACWRYLQMTGFAAPCVAGGRVADKNADLLAREVLAQELGHSRVDVIAAYVGGRR